MSMNETILAGDFPAVREISVSEIRMRAREAAEDLRTRGFCHLELEPDDGTRYEVVIVVSDLRHGAPFRFSSNHGSLYPWMGHPSVHPDYAEEHYVGNSNRWTAVVLSLFLNFTAEHMEAAR